jgi:hypothetical protein
VERRCEPRGKHAPTSHRRGEATEGRERGKFLSERACPPLPAPHRANARCVASRYGAASPRQHLPGKTLSDVIGALATASKPARLIAGWLDALDETGRWALLKLIMGALRIGVSARLAKTAAASLGDKEPDEIELVWPGLTPPYEDLFAWLEGRAPRPEASDPAPFRPPMLSHAIEDGDFDKLDPADFTAEWKWDGIRVQASRASRTRDRVVRLYSRTGEDISAPFPISAEAHGLRRRASTANCLILRDRRVQSFNVLQQRLNRKAGDTGHAHRIPAHIRAYDLLVDGAEDLRGFRFSPGARGWRPSSVASPIRASTSRRSCLSRPGIELPVSAPIQLRPAPATMPMRSRAHDQAARCAPTCRAGRRACGTNGSATRWWSTAC